jgi:hypothetical protein
MASRFMLAVFAVGSLPACDAGTGPAQAEFPAELTERIEWLESNASPLTHITPGVEDYGDLEPLRQAIGGAHVVRMWCCWASSRTATARFS